MRYTGPHDRGIAVQILFVLAFLGIAVLMYLAFSPAMSEMATVSGDLAQGTYYEDEATSMIGWLEPLSTTGLLVAAVIIGGVYLLARSVFLTNVR